MSTTNTPSNVFFSLPNNLKLSYDIIRHKKVVNSANSSEHLYMCIPYGKKWIAYFKNNKCFFYDADMNTFKPHKWTMLKPEQKEENLGFGDGTILYGTKLAHMSSVHFCIEDILYYKSVSVQNETWQHKFSIITELLSISNSVGFGERSVLFGIPLCDVNLNTLIQIKLSSINYKVYSIHKYEFADINKYCSLGNDFQRMLGTSNSPTNHNTSNTKSNNRIEGGGNASSNVSGRVKIIKPEIQNDIYSVYELDGTTKIGLAGVPSYETSVLLNRIFRHIKENDDLDKLEESDDEVDFEDDSIDKYVYVNKSVTMVCDFNVKLKKWVPLKEINTAPTRPINLKIMKRKRTNEVKLNML